MPSDDGQVLERLPEKTSPQLRVLRGLRAALAAAPTDISRAAPLARAYIEASREEGDPRYLGYAQAALGPWWNDPNAPTIALVLRATIRQSNHEFDAAKTDLAVVLQREPRNAQALLTRATILNVQGKYAEARADCTRLNGIVPPVYIVICLAAIDSVTGQATHAYQTLGEAMQNFPRVDSVAREWSETLLGEIAHRTLRADAEAHFKAALHIDARDPYLIGVYADWLLDQGRPADVLPLIGSDTRIDPLLLRLALAQAALKHPDAPATIAAVGARVEASRARGDTVHQREESRYALHLAGDAKNALELARRDWAVQREPADARVLAEAAAATNDADALSIARHWIAETGLEYDAVTRVLTGAGK